MDNALFYDDCNSSDCHTQILIHSKRGKGYLSRRKSEILKPDEGQTVYRLYFILYCLCLELMVYTDVSFDVKTYAA